MMSKRAVESPKHCWAGIRARRAGALGGKLLGAGGGGFLLLFCRKENREQVRQALLELKEV
ncbi:hypothetical protein HQ563_03850, partial [bacterium]|nr:hypothetical protein [bacterium]